MTTYKIQESDLQNIFRNMLEKNIVEGIMVQKKGDHGIFPALITDPDLLDDIVPSAPLFSFNRATMLQHNGSRKLAVVVNPCEARAINELKKLKQVDMDGLIVISGDCLGTFDPKDVQIDATNPANIAENKENLRSACTVCEHFTPPEVDIAIYGIGVDGGLILSTEREDLLEGLSLTPGEPSASREAEVKKILDQHLATKEKMVTGITKMISTTDAAIDVFKHCIRCDNCRDVCPICYCKVCYFQTPIGDLKTDDMVNQASIKGLLRIPPDILFYHLTRNIHVAAGCVECGACEEACPRDIPLLPVWKALASDVQTIFDYIAGMEKEVPMPLVKFKEDEFEDH